MIRFLEPAEPGLRGDNVTKSSSALESAGRLKRACELLMVPLAMAHGRYSQLKQIYPEAGFAELADQVRFEMWDSFWVSPWWIDRLN
jgi:hypothetical protein